MTLTQMRQLLEARGIQLTKSLGQNFLHDVHQLERIAAAADLTEADRVLEIGPGLGPLTRLLVQHSHEVLAVEKDARLVRVLEQEFESVPTLRLLHADALDWLKAEQRDWSGWKMVSNLPYSVASPILVELCQGERSPKLIVATLQLEVVQRLMAQPASKDYGVLTLLIQLDYQPEWHFKIPSGCFFPQPDVESACVVLKRRAAALLSESRRKDFKRVVKQAFSQRRKMMFKLLKQQWKLDALDAAFQKLGLSSQIRAEAVSLEQFVQLTSELAG